MANPPINIPDPSPWPLWCGFVEWGNIVIVVAFLALCRLGADRWRIATLMAYGPRWMLLLPGCLIAIGIVFLSRRAPWITIASIIITVGPVMMWNIPQLARSAAGGRSIRLLTLNANGDDTDGKSLDQNRLATLVQQIQPDVIALEEWPADGVPSTWGAGWHVRQLHNIVVASRFPILESQHIEGSPLGGEGGAVGCRLGVDGGRAVWMFGLHLETPRRGFKPVLARQAGGWAAFEASINRRAQISVNITNWIRSTSDNADDVLIAGDFNLIPDSGVFRSNWSGWQDAFTAAGWGWGWSKFTSIWGLRIDHVLAGRRWRVNSCTVLGDVGSDHRPLLATLTVD